MENNKQTEKAKELSFEINSQRKKLNFTLEPKNTKPYDIEKMTGKNPGQKDNKKK